MIGPIPARVALAALAAWMLVPVSGRAEDVLNLARTSWRCTTSARLDDAPRQGYVYFHPNGRVKMAQVVPVSNRERASGILWWRTREEYDFEDPTGRMWTDPDRLDDGTIWASRRDQTRVVYGSPAGLIIMSVPRNRIMHARFVELDGRSQALVERGETDPFALVVQPARLRSTMMCELRPGWLQ